MNKKKRGRPHRHWAELLRVAIWYKEVKRRSGWTDYKLNKEFAWSEIGHVLIRQSQNQNEKGNLATTNRPRIFEWIRKTGKKPAGRDEKWQNMEQIVDAVDIVFSGTKHLYCTKFWNLLQVDKISIISIEIEAEELLNQFNLVQLNHEQNKTLENLVNKYGFVPVFDRCLRLSLRKLDRLSAIVLIWYLYLLAEPVNEIREIIEKVADTRVEKFFNNYFLDIEAFDYYKDVINTLRHTRLDLGASSDAYDFLDTQARLMILPDELLSSITEGHLFHTYESLAHIK